MECFEMNRNYNKFKEIRNTKIKNQYEYFKRTGKVEIRFDKEEIDIIEKYISYELEENERTDHQDKERWEMFNYIMFVVPSEFAYDIGERMKRSKVINEMLEHKFLKPGQQPKAQIEFEDIEDLLKEGVLDEEHK